MPKVIVTDRDGALMKVVATVFPETDTMICFFHIGKNGRVKFIMNCRVKPKPPKGAKVDKKQVKKDKENNRQDAFNELMSKEAKPLKKPTNEHNPIIYDNTPTPKKKYTRILSHGRHERRRRLCIITRLL